MPSNRVSDCRASGATRNEDKPDPCEVKFNKGTRKTNEMKKLQIGIAIGAIALGIVGCVSVDGTRAQLSSKNASEVKKGEETIYTIATTGRDSSGFVQFQTPQQVEYVQLTSNQDLLLRIIDNAYNDEVIAAATERLDFSKKGAAHSFVQQRFSKLGSVDKERKKALKEQIISKLTQEELLDLIGDRKTNNERFKKMMSESTRGGRRGASSYDLGYDDKDMLLNRLIAITDSPTVLWRMLEGDIHISNQRGAVERRLLSMLDKVTDEQMIEKILSAHNQSGMRLVGKPEQRIPLIKKLPESKIVTLALKNIDDHSVYAWNKGDLSALETGIGITASIKDTKSVAKIVAAVLAKIAEYRKECEGNWTMSWGKGDEEQAKKLIAGLPKLSDSVIAALVCLNESSWKYLIDKVTEENAYNILTRGKAKSDELEIALVRKLPTQKVDMKVFAGVKTDAGKKAVMAAMPAEVKKAAQESTAKALAVVMEKAKEAEKETFAYNGFYLGMSVADAKAMFVHHFPDVQFEEGIDGEGDEADYCIHVPGQSNPFCFASKKDGKVYQFNFGKGLLKKWCKYDVSTVRDWAKTFAREHKIAMELDFIDRDGEVYTMAGDLSAEPHPVSLHQEIWTYKSGSKDYRLTYFGERKISGYGAVIRELAREKYRYVSADQGTLRAAIDNN